MSLRLNGHMKTADEALDCFPGAKALIARIYMEYILAGIDYSYQKCGGSSSVFFDSLQEYLENLLKVATFPNDFRECMAKAVVSDLPGEDKQKAVLMCVFLFVISLVESSCNGRYKGSEGWQEIERWGLENFNC